MVGGAPQPRDSIIDPFRVQWANTSLVRAMGLFVVTEKVDVNDGQAATDIDLGAITQFAQQDGDGDSSRYEFHSCRKPCPRTRPRTKSPAQGKLHQQQHAGAYKL